MGAAATAPALVGKPDARAAVTRRNAKRLSALAAESTTVPNHAVRPDYFGTAEHSALGEYLQRILNGEPVIGKPAADESHVLFGPRNRSAKIVLEAKPRALVDLMVAQTGTVWLQQLRSSLTDTMSRYEPNRELYVRSGLTLRYGEVVALAGDYFESPQELREELTEEVASSIRKVTPQSPGTFLLSTHRGWGNYLGLANRNQVHFAPRSWVAYARYHATALKYALDRSYEEALFANGFADHFLSDAFASGHLRLPREDLAGIFGAPASRRMHNEENEQGLWVQDGTGNVWRAYGDDKLGTNPVHVVLTAYAMGVSLQRVHVAYRLEGAEAKSLAEAIEQGLAALPPTADEKSWPAGSWKDPDTLPPFLGPVAGLPDIRARIPVPLGWSKTPRSGELANYEPMRWVPQGGSLRKRIASPPWGEFFKIRSA